MFKSFARFLSVVLCALFIVGLWSNVAPGAAIQVTIDGRLVNFPDQQPYIDTFGRTLVPVRFVSEELGARVEWMEDNKLVILHFRDETVRLTVNSSIAIKVTGGVEHAVLMDSLPVLRNGRVMVPLRFVSETLGGKVDWIAATNTVSISSPPSTPGTPGKPPVVIKEPYRELLELNAQLDKNPLSRIVTRDSYTMLKLWRNVTPTTSAGAYAAFVEKVDVKDFQDYMYLEIKGAGLQDVWWMSVYLASDENNTHHYYHDVTSQVVKGDGQLVINMKDFIVGGGAPNWDTLQYFRIAFQANPGKIVSIQPTMLATYKAKAMATISFDDGWEDNYTNAFRIMSGINKTMPGQVAIVPSFIDSEFYLKPSQMKELTAAGWEFYNHSYSHLFMTELSAEEVREEIIKAYSYISEFDPTGAYHFAVPYSTVDSQVLQILKNNALSARYVAEKINPIPFNRYEIAFMEVTNVTAFSTVKEWIDQTIDQKKWILLMFHRIDDPAEDRYTYSTSNFRRIIEYLDLRKSDIQVVTVSDALRESGYILPTR